MNKALSLLCSGFLALERRVTGAAVFLGSLSLVLAFLAGLYQVLARFVLFQPAPWSEPFIQSTLIWMTYLTLAAAMRSGSLIAVDLLIRLGNDHTRMLLRAIGTISIMGLLLVLFWFGWLLVQRVQYQTLAGLGISASWAYAALPVGAVLSMIALIAHLIDPDGPNHDAPDTSA